MLFKSIALVFFITASSAVFAQTNQAEYGGKLILINRTGDALTFTPSPQNSKCLNYPQGTQSFVVENNTSLTLIFKSTADCILPPDRLADDTDQLRITTTSDNYFVSFLGFNQTKSRFTPQVSFNMYHATRMLYWNWSTLRRETLKLSFCSSATIDPVSKECPLQIP